MPPAIHLAGQPAPMPPPEGLAPASAPALAPAGSPWAPAPFAAALRRALRDAAGRVVLRVEEAAPHRRRVARALLQEGALAAGGQVMEGPGGDLLLVGAEARRAERLRGLLERLVGPAGTLLWSLERDADSLLAYAAGAAAAAPRQAVAGPGLAGLDAFLDAMPLARAVRRRVGVALGAAERPAFLRLEPAREEIAAMLGQLGADADLLDHAARRVSARLVAALANGREARALLGEGLPPRLHLPLPPGRAASGPPLPPGVLVATLPLAEAADPAALAARAAALAAGGIATELDGLDEAALGLLDPAALPGALLRLRWSPGLAGPGPMAALRRLDPARLVLAVPGGLWAEPRGFAAALGIALAEPA